MQPPEHPFHNILVVTDFSDHSAAAMGRAVSLAENGDVKITALHVIADVASAVPGTSFAGHWRIPPGELHHAEEKLRNHATERLGAWLAPLVKPGREVVSEVRVGVPDIEIIHAVLHNKHDLVLASGVFWSAARRSDSSAIAPVRSGSFSRSMNGLCVPSSSRSISPM